MPSRHSGDFTHAFYPQLYPGLTGKMAKAFIGDHGKSPSAAFLWSLGEGEEARGYGKTTHLLWFAECVNADLGKRALELAGRSSTSRRWIAAYAAFNTIEGLSLSNLLFDVVRDLTSGNVMVSLRNDAYQQGRTVQSVYTKAALALSSAGEQWSVGLLRTLCYGSPQEWAGYVSSGYRFSSWHKVRYGRRLLRTLLAFLRELGIDHLLVLVDQVEDFASFSTPAYKLRRDFPRLAYLCSEDRVTCGHVSFVLTMHPRAARSLFWHWPDDVLGPIGLDGSPANVVCIGEMTKSKFKELVKIYLDTARIGGPTKTLDPLGDDAVDFVHGLDHGRPGYCLQRLFLLFDAAARARVRYIDRAFAESFFGSDGDSE